MSTPPSGCLTGTLTMQSVPEQLKRSASLISGGVLDLSGITQADSAGVAFLLELTRRAASKGGSIRFTGAPKQLLELTRFFELDEAIDLREGT